MTLSKNTSRAVLVMYHGSTAMSGRHEHYTYYYICSDVHECTTNIEYIKQLKYGEKNYHKTHQGTLVVCKRVEFG